MESFPAFSFSTGMSSFPELNQRSHHHHSQQQQQQQQQQQHQHLIHHAYLAHRTGPNHTIQGHHHSHSAKLVQNRPQSRRDRCTCTNMQSLHYSRHNKLHPDQYNLESQISAQRITLNLSNSINSNESASKKRPVIMWFTPGAFRLDDLRAWNHAVQLARSRNTYLIPLAVSTCPSSSPVFRSSSLDSPSFANCLRELDISLRRISSKLFVLQLADFASHTNAQMKRTSQACYEAVFTLAKQVNACCIVAAHDSSTSTIHHFTSSLQSYATSSVTAPLVLVHHYPNGYPAVLQPALVPPYPRFPVLYGLSHPLSTFSALSLKSGPRGELTTYKALLSYNHSHYHLPRHSTQNKSIPILSIPSHILTHFAKELRAGSISFNRIYTHISLALSSSMSNVNHSGCTTLRSSLHLGHGSPLLTACLPLALIPTYEVTPAIGTKRELVWDPKLNHLVPKDSPNKKSFNISELINKWSRFLHHAFVPDHVSPDYYVYSTYRFLQRVVSQAVGVFGTKALLVALGLRSGKIGQAAAVSWVLKDGLGRVGKMIWASSMGKDFDVYPKKWRFKSALLYTLGNGLDICVQVVPSAFLLIATLANSMKQVSILTSAATRNAFYKNFSGRRDNLANITAKGEAQIVVADLLGMALGIYLTKTLGTHRNKIIIAYTLLSTLDIVGIYRQMRSVVFATINPERAAHIVKAFCANNATPTIPTPAEVSPKESIFFNPVLPVESFASFPEAISSEKELQGLLKIFHKDNFLISSACIEARYPTGILEKRKQKKLCHVVLNRSATSEDIMKAILTMGYVRAANQKFELENKKINQKSKIQRNTGPYSKDPDALLHWKLGIIETARKTALKNYKSFMSKLRAAGWQTDHLSFGNIKKKAAW